MVELNSMIPITPDLRQNIIVTAYLLFSHNYIAFAYFIGLIISIILSIKWPSRFSTFSFLGFAILLFSYEYDKHIIEGFRQQTMRSLITLQPHLRFQRLISVTITEILPIFFYVAGWAFIYLAIIHAARKLGKREK
ncbi:hypothetical protein A3D03_01835 [Candidatus Gottesmanbacteria bacterium RIFCSPHIGHO2_02_FULL_40_13]|uniref:Uncharacterized protein n=1 Tax=Candidatus Gottesmanbacteria bacterium RIFCSPHIGHO2_02_FULL_40_13 TaxID=1798384 RepID=A0A1F6A7E7_9BACT|nr:MAG: hypothetical protein A3D03_01835 [Candidatus Gottesmanbacteria bacterium RIFCSPHIGHO2_02_FULL_40_13]